MYIFDDTDDAFPVSFFPSTRAPTTPSTWAGLSDKFMAPITRALERTKADSAPADGDEAIAREGGGRRRRADDGANSAAFGRGAASDRRAA